MAKHKKRAGIYGILFLVSLRTLALCNTAAPNLLPRRASGSVSPLDTGEQQSRALEQKIESVTAPEVDALAKALGLSAIVENPVGGGQGRPLYEVSQLRALGVMPNSQDPQCVVYLSGHGADEGEQAVGEGWVLEFVAWDGTQWRGSRLDQSPPGESLPADWKSQTQPLGVEIISHSSGEEMLALVLYDAPTTAVYPLVFRIAGHAASLVWDSRSDESRYEALSAGEVHFRMAIPAGVPDMIESGKADPGLLVFDRGGSRGFTARTTYRWEGNAYLPVGTEYEVNEDLRLYEFISALHLHNYAAAYSLVDPAKFLGTDQPSLDAFRDAIQKNWREFLDDQIFHASAPGKSDTHNHAFEIDEGGKKIKYFPTFSSGPKFLLTNLTRQEE